MALDGDVLLGCLGAGVWTLQMREMEALRCGNAGA